LEPHPRWRWASYPLRWLIGGCWSLWHSPLRGMVYGAVFFGVALAWTRALSDLTTNGFAVATALTGFTLLLAPRLTAGLVDGLGGHGRMAAPLEQDEQRKAALIGIGAFLVMILSIGLNTALVCFTLLFSGDMPALDALPAAVFSWENAPLALLLVAVLFLAGFAMQVVAVLPTFILQEWDVDLFVALRSSVRVTGMNWRPLACWAAGCQVLLLAGAALAPPTLFVLAPMIACGSWWACREMVYRGTRPGTVTARIR
jgi:uncharacterized membrane protein